MVKNFVNKDVGPGYKFSTSGDYFVPDIGNQKDYMEHIDSTFEQINPDLYGLHENAEITTNQGVARSMMDTLLSIQPRSGGGSGRTAEDVMKEAAEGMLKEVPAKFDLDLVMGK